jgi:hypothetical protein
MSEESFEIITSLTSLHKCTSTSTSTSIEDIKEDYTLNREKAIDTKIKSATKLGVQYEETEGGHVVTLNTGTYEVLKPKIIDFYKNHNDYKFESRSRTDKEDNIVDILLTIYSKSTDIKLFVIHLYNKQSKILINGSTPHIFKQHLYKFYDEIDEEQVRNINQTLMNVRRSNRTRKPTEKMAMLALEETHIAVSKTDTRASTLGDEIETLTAEKSEILHVSPEQIVDSKNDKLSFSPLNPIEEEPKDEVEIHVSCSDSGNETITEATKTNSSSETKCKSTHEMEDFVSSSDTDFISADNFHEDIKTMGTPKIKRLKRKKSTPRKTTFPDKHNERTNRMLSHIGDQNARFANELMDMNTSFWKEMSQINSSIKLMESKTNEHIKNTNIQLKNLKINLDDHIATTSQTFEQIRAEMESKSQIAKVQRRKIETAVDDLETETHKHLIDISNAMKDQKQKLNNCESKINSSTAPDVKNMEKKLKSIEQRLQEIENNKESTVNLSKPENIQKPNNEQASIADEQENIAEEGAGEHEIQEKTPDLITISTSKRIKAERCTFQAFCATVTSDSEVDRFTEQMHEAYPDTKDATHTMLAVKYTDENDKINMETNDGLGEHQEMGSSEKMLQVIMDNKLDNVAIIVCRWYGGEHIYGLRFETIITCTTQALHEAGILKINTSRSTSVSRGKILYISDSTGGDIIINRMVPNQNGRKVSGGTLEGVNKVLEKAGPDFHKIIIQSGINNAKVECTDEVKRKFTETITLAKQLLPSSDIYIVSLTATQIWERHI